MSLRRQVNLPALLPELLAHFRHAALRVGDGVASGEDRSVGVGLIWQSPFGPLRFDYAVPITKGRYDRVQEFRFGGGTTF